MAFIHTIQLTNEKRVANTVSATRKSENRQYGACIVVTTTEASLKVDAEKLAATIKERDEWQAKLTALIAKLGMTVEQANAQHQADSDRWYNRSNSKDPKDAGLFETRERIRKEREAKNHGFYTPIPDKDIEADLIARGFNNPYDREGAFGIHEAAGKVEWLNKTIASWKSPELGSQGVISWHGSVALAQKAMGSRECEWHRKKGDTLKIRTDIEVKETKKREKKSV